MNARLALLLGLIALSTRTSAQQVRESIFVLGEVNGNTVHFDFDTGAGCSLLMRQTVQKLGLELTPSRTNFPLIVAGGRRQYLDTTKEYSLKVGIIEGPTVFAVLDAPAWAEADFEGILGWTTVTNCIVNIDAMSGGVSFLGEVPQMATHWAHVPAVPVYTGLALKIPHGDGTSGLLIVDTGSDRGVALPPSAWRKWLNAHENAPLALETFCTPSDGFYIYEEAWADSISFGPITLNNVPIEQAGPAGPEVLGKEYEGTIGMEGLTRLELTVDPAHEVAYWRLRKSTHSNYSYNRLGAVFPPTTEQPDKAVARVIENGPAYVAGLRDGDVLLEVDGIKATGWKEKTRRWVSHFSLPAGTKLKLTLERKGGVFQTTATLAEILQANRNADQH